MSLDDEKSLSYLQYMQQALNDILEHTNNLTFDEFVQDKATSHSIEFYYSR